MTKDVYAAINSDALYNKSKVYIGRALTRKANNELDEYQLWASLALELLGKAALAQKHPSLIVDPNHWKSLFVAAGINITTDVKTITASTLFERLSHCIQRFDSRLKEFCEGISARRNAELHSAELPFRAMRLDAWETRYWHACDTILQHLESTLDDWLGAADAKAPRQLLVEASNALEAAVKHRIEAAKRQFEERKKPEKERLIAEANLLHPVAQAALFRKEFDGIWDVVCPACAGKAFMAGEQTREDITEDRDDSAIWEIVEREFVGEQFICPICELAFKGTDELVVSNLEYIHSDEQTREIEYEPDYGND